MLNDLIISLIAIAGGIAPWTIRWIIWQQDGLTFVDFRSVMVTPSDILIALALVIELARLLTSATARSESWDAVRLLRRVGGLPLLALWLWMIVGLLWSSAPILTGYVILRGLMLGFLAVVLCRLRHAWLPILTIIGLFACLQSVIAVLQVIQGESIGLFHLGEMNMHNMRGYGLTVNPNNLSGYLVAVLWLLVAVVYSSDIKNRHTLWLWWAILMVIAIGILMTASRAAIFGMIAGGSVLVFRWGVLPQWRRWLVAITLVLGVVFVAMRGLDVREIQTRLSQYYEETLRVWATSPLQGQGANGLMVRVDDLLDPNTPTVYRMPAHNTYLVLLAELGVIGLVLWAWWWGSAIRYAWQQYHLILGGLVALSVIMIFDYYFVLDIRSQIWLFWLWAGITHSTAHRPPEPTQTDGVVVKP